MPSISGPAIEATVEGTAAPPRKYTVVHIHVSCKPTGCLFHWITYCPSRRPSFMFHSSGMFLLHLIHSSDMFLLHGGTRRFFGLKFTLKITHSGRMGNTVRPLILIVVVVGQLLLQLFCISHAFSPETCVLLVDVSCCILAAVTLSDSQCHPVHTAPLKVTTLRVRTKKLSFDSLAFRRSSAMSKTIRQFATKLKYVTAIQTPLPHVGGVGVRVWCERCMMSPTDGRIKHTW